MNYTKPTIMLIDAAKSAIKGHIPKSNPPTDVSPTNAVTSAAYEADE
jgi:hypothetical protein